MQGKPSFSNRRIHNTINRLFTVDGTRIRTQDTIKYLGLHLDQKLTYNKHTDAAITNAALALSKIYPLLNKNSNLDIINKILPYKTTIRRPNKLTKANNQQMNWAMGDRVDGDGRLFVAIARGTEP